MVQVTSERLKTYRLQTFSSAPGAQVKSLPDAIAFVKRRGFVFFWPINGIELPSLWTAVAGERPVADAHDDPGHVTWGWKDTLLGGREWYYAKVLRKRATMISFDLVPYFYALSQNYGAYEEDYLTQYEQGGLTMEARQIYETLLDRGPTDTVELRRLTRMSSVSSESRFNRAVVELQSDFKILPVAVTESGAWHYAFAYDIVARHHPQIPEVARTITELEARQVLIETYARSLGAVLPQDIQRLFGWQPGETRRAVEAALAGGRLTAASLVAGLQGEWLASPNLLGGD